ncbi:hypothetical protein GS597_10895 [Synechococcales cyanobacterium C]|uniref:Uncharacterized protein n=1 Tax=Petrachloros mirabilis ULC683 TaxID=2781853 RepID=A0A8K1ZZJ9_9CYAN|nr:hypothetical protein [Petrachloros mirabilis]NCJ07006.1 hypothetical protein [Petrachloros mirabilis ULC683]
MNSNTANSETIGRKNQPIELLKSGQLLALSQHEPGGLILQKPYHAEFVNAGSAVGGMFDTQCVTLYTLGAVEFTVPESTPERQVAFQQRMDDIDAMQQLCQDDSPLRRAVAIVQLLCERFGVTEVQSIPNDVLAKLVGVLPGTVAIAWQQQLSEVKNADKTPTDATMDARLAVA